MLEKICFICCFGWTNETVSKSAKGASLNSTFKFDDFIELKILSNLSFLSGWVLPLNFFKQSLWV